jgi:hypothetical protein
MTEEFFRHRFTAVTPLRRRRSAPTAASRHGDCRVVILP